MPATARFARRATLTACIAIAALAGLGLPLRAAAAEPLPDSTVAPQAAADARPALWSVDYQGQRSWLFGVVPWGEAGRDPLPAAVRAAMQASELLASEVRQPVNPMEAAALLAPLRQAGHSFKSQLDPTLKAPYEALCAGQQLPCEALDTLPPFFVVASLYKMMGAKAGLPLSDDNAMSAVHQAFKDQEFLELEGLPAGFQLMQRVPAADQEALLRRLLREQGQDSVRSYAAWRRGDTDALLANLDSSAFSPVTLQQLLGGRSQAWTEKLMPVLRQGRRVFISVAAGLTVGPQGLVASLQRQGARVARVVY